MGARIHRKVRKEKRKIYDYFIIAGTQKSSQVQQFLLRQLPWKRIPESSVEHARDDRLFQKSQREGRWIHTELEKVNLRLPRGALMEQGTNISHQVSVSLNKRQSIGARKKSIYFPRKVFHHLKRTFKSRSRIPFES